MKAKVLMLLGVLLLTVSSCRFNRVVIGPLIDPSENIVRAKYPQEVFDRVESHVVGRIQLVQSDQSRVTLSAPDNYIDLFEFKNRHGRLTIEYTENDINIHNEDVTIIIYTPTLKEIENLGAADIHLDSLQTDELKVRNTGVGTFELNHIIADRVEVSCSGVGGININGQTDEAEYSCSGVGGIMAKDMKSRRTRASVSGIGGIDCHASEYIDGNVSGVGGLNYAGHPAQKNLHNSMTGSINEID